jgi:serine/threonine protein kinase/DNA-binding beta-propeller fold protein YncE
MWRVVATASIPEAQLQQTAAVRPTIPTRDSTEDVCLAHWSPLVVLMAADRWLGVELAGYRIDALVGRGGAGVVYRATHVQLGRLVALKLLAPSLAADAEYRRRFEREARVAAGLDHPHIVPIYDAGYAQDVLYLAMRFIDGPTLDAVIDEGPMAPGRVCELLTGVADALDHAHRAGLVHRDVKPGNVLIGSPDQPTGGESAYLCDFGIARRSTATSALTTTGQFLGTLQYCSPEQIQGRHIDGRADQYALACVAYHCLTGRVPYPADELAAMMFAHVSADPPRASAHVPTLPIGMDDVIVRALAKDPEQRFPDCTTFMRELTAARNSPAYSAGHGTPLHTVIWSSGVARRESRSAPATATSDTHSSLSLTALRSRLAGLSWWKILLIRVISFLGLAGLGAIGVTLGGSITDPVAATTISLPGGLQPGEGEGQLAISPDGRYVYRVGQREVTVIDTAENVVSRTIPVPRVIGGEIAITPDGRRAYTTKQGDVYSPRDSKSSLDPDYANVVAIDTVTNAVTTIPSPISGVPHGVVVAPDGRYAYVTVAPDLTDLDVARHDYVLVIDTSSDKVTATIPFRPSGSTADLTITPDGRSLYVAGSLDQTMIDIAGKTVEGTVHVPDEYAGGTLQAVLAPNGLAYIAISHGVLVAAPGSGTIQGTVPISGDTQGIAIAPDGRHVYAGVRTAKDSSQGFTDDLVAIDTANNTVSTTKPIPATCGKAIAITPDSRYAYLSCASSMSVVGIGE